MISLFNLLKRPGQKIGPNRAKYHLLTVGYRMRVSKKTHSHRMLRNAMAVKVSIMKKCGEVVCLCGDIFPRSKCVQIVQMIDRSSFTFKVKHDFLFCYPFQTLCFTLLFHISILPCKAM